MAACTAESCRGAGLPQWARRRRGMTTAIGVATPRSTLARSQRIAASSRVNLASRFVGGPDVEQVFGRREEPVQVAVVDESAGHSPLSRGRACASRRLRASRADRALG